MLLFLYHHKEPEKSPVNIRSSSAGNEAGGSGDGCGIAGIWEQFDQNLCPLFCWVPRNSPAEFSAVCGRQSRGVIWSGGRGLSEERRDVWFVCVRGRQTDRQGESAAESSSEIQGVAIETPCAQ